MRITHLLPIQKELSLHGPTFIFTGQDVEKGSFAGTRSTHDGEDLAGGDYTVDILEDGFFADAVGDVAELEGCGDVVVD